MVHSIFCKKLAPNKRVREQKKVGKSGHVRHKIDADSGLPQFLHKKP